MQPTDPIQIQVSKNGAFKRHYAFFLNDTLLATLIYGSTWRDDAIIQIGDHTWQIKRIGFWKKQIELKADQSPYTKVSIPYNWKYRISYRTDSGIVYSFKPTGFWKRTWAWFNEKEQMVIGMKTVASFSKRRGEISIYQPPTEELYLLMILGWYQLLTYQQHASAAATT
jgi:hypothetical protein